MKVRGGQNIYGFSVGILMLDTQFPRIPGDMGNAATFDFPVLYHRVRGASPDLVVRHGQRALLPTFIEGARALEREGVRAVTTNCGFLCHVPDRHGGRRLHPGLHVESHAGAPRLSDAAPGQGRRHHDRGCLVAPPRPLRGRRHHSGHSHGDGGPRDGEGVHASDAR